MQRVPDNIRRHFTDGQVERETPLIVDGKRAQTVSQPASGVREPSSAGNSACSGVCIYCPSCASALFLSG